MMKLCRICGAAMVLSAALLASSCARNESSVDKAVESTKDALDMRDHEKLKDAGEDVQDAVNDAAEGVKDAVNGK
jgi:hypothetical protein